LLLFFLYLIFKWFKCHYSFYNPCLWHLWNTIHPPYCKCNTFTSTLSQA